MKNWQIVIVMFLSLTLISSVACNPFGGGQAETQPTIKVEIDNLKITVSGSGNIEYYDDVDLSFGIGGRVREIFFKEGDKVNKGDVIARLETDDLELAVSQAEVAYAKARVAVNQSEESVTQAEAGVASAELNLANAEVDLEQTAKTSTVSDIKVAQADVDTAQRDLNEALFTLSKYDPGTPGYDEYQKLVILVEARLQTAKDKFNALLFGFGTKEVQAKQQQVEAAQKSLEVAKESLGLAMLSPDLARDSLKLASQSLDNARNQLDKATIIAPFDGVIASRNVDEGDSVLASSPIVHLVMPGQLELKVQVDEIDVPDMKIGQKATIELDALPDMSLDGQVSSISLLPTVEAGVIVYSVTVQFDIPAGVGLRAGMSATADIITQERDNVLIVPSRAIKKDSNGNSVVDVVTANGGTEQKTVTVGISDGFNTEIVSGLEEGQVIVEK